jgi:hypothetical protein
MDAEELDEFFARFVLSQLLPRLQFESLHVAHFYSVTESIFSLDADGNQMISFEGELKRAGRLRRAVVESD